MFRKIGTEVSARHMPKLPKYNDPQLKFSSMQICAGFCAKSRALWTRFGLAACSVPRLQADKVDVAKFSWIKL